MPAPTIRGSVLVATALVAVAPQLASAATIPVDVTSDEINADADCSLREAVQAANANASNTTGCVDGEGAPVTDTIVLAPGAQYSRSIPPDGTRNDNQDGDLDFVSAGPVVVQGDAGDRPILFGGGADRVIDAPNGGVDLTLERIIVTDGVTIDGVQGNGGGVRSAGGVLTLTDSTVFDNQAEENGGGISSAATTNLTGATLAENTAGGSGGGLSSGTAPLVVADSVIADNLAGAGPSPSVEQGGGIVTAADSVSVTDSTLSGNDVLGNNASGGGLAMYSSSGGQKTVSRSSFVNNTADQLGGGVFISLGSPDAPVTIDSSRLEENDAGPGPSPSVSGGGVRVAFGDLQLTRTVVRGNTAESDLGGSNGGGIAIGSQGEGTIDDSAIISNDAIASPGNARGGGIDVDGSLLLRRTTIALNALNGSGGGDDGAGLFAGPTSAGVNAFNVTISGNTALDAGADGGGVHVQNASSFVNLHSSTVAFNTAGGAADPGDALSGPAPLLSARNSIIHGVDAADVCEGVIGSAGHNVAVGTSCGLSGTGDLQGAVIHLAGLEANGGLAAGPPGDTEAVPTRAFAAASPAIDAVPLGSCTGQTSATLATDARAFPRPFGDACDAGALEVTRCFGQAVEENAIVGTEGDDVLAGTAAADLLFPLAGADAVRGNKGADLICADGGKDALRGGRGNDKLDGGKAKDTCKGGRGTDAAKACERKSGIP